PRWTRSANSTSRSSTSTWTRPSRRSPRRFSEIDRPAVGAGMVRHPDAAAGFSAPGARRSGSAVRAHSSFRLSPHAAVVAVHNQDREIVTVSQDITAAPEAVLDPPVGITNPPIDELLKTASSKYALVIFAAK